MKNELFVVLEKRSSDFEIVESRGADSERDLNLSGVYDKKGDVVHLGIVQKQLGISCRQKSQKDRTFCRQNSK
ncbi:MAG: hypothetical protein GY866_17650 [Proteobacteria bacterium]|nr:hypothetical protein [Pseudomonadota bacterium]